MYRNDFIKAISQKLRDLGIRKPVRTPKHVFHISDDNGTTKDFVVKETDRSEIFTIADVENFLDAMVDVVKETLVRGEPIRVRGFGTFELKLKNKTHVILNGKDIDVPERYMPSFTFSPEFKVYGKLFELSLENMISKQDREPTQTDDGESDGGDA